MRRRRRRRRALHPAAARRVPGAPASQPAPPPPICAAIAALLRRTFREAPAARPIQRGAERGTWRRAWTGARKPGPIVRRHSKDWYILKRPAAAPLNRSTAPRGPARRAAGRCAARGA